MAAFSLVDHSYLKISRNVVGTEYVRHISSNFLRSFGFHFQNAPLILLSYLYVRGNSPFPPTVFTTNTIVDALRSIRNFSKGRESLLTSNLRPLALWVIIIKLHTTVQPGPYGYRLQQAEYQPCYDCQSIPAVDGPLTSVECSIPFTPYRDLRYSASLSDIVLVFTCYGKKQKTKMMKARQKDPAAGKKTFKNLFSRLEDALFVHLVCKENSIHLICDIFHFSP